MKRKLTTFVLALAITAGALGAAPASAAADTGTELAMAVLEGLGAFEDGDMASSETITRGEFARLLAYAIGKGAEVSTYERRTMYADVPAGSENAGYINLVSSEGVLTGNGDGTFSPDDGITYASAVTAAIRMLGYTSAEAGTAWPDDYIDLAGEIGISDGLSLNADSGMTVGQAAELLFNAMRADTASGTSYASQMSASSVSGAILLSNSASSDLGYCPTGTSLLPMHMNTSPASSSSARLSKPVMPLGLPSGTHRVTRFSSRSIRLLSSTKSRPSVFTLSSAVMSS